MTNLQLPTIKLGNLNQTTTIYIIKTEPMFPSDITVRKYSES